MNIADFIIHVHSDLTEDQRTKIEESTAAKDGVLSVHFSPGHTHELTVAYDPQVIHSDVILKQIRHWDKGAVMFGL